MNSDMPRIKYPYLQREKTRHGVWVWYVRIDRAAPRIRIRGDYDGEQFKAEYLAAIAAAPAMVKPAAAHKGSMQWLVDRWRESSDWHMTAKSTQRQRENILVHVLEKSAGFPFAKVSDSDILAGRERRMKTPFAANNYLKTMRALFGWAKEAKLVNINPAAEVAFLSRKTGGHEPWTAEDVARYAARWPLGTRQRIAMEVLLWTGLRRGDAVRLGRQHIGGDGVARLKAEKTATALYIAIPAPLREAIDAGPVGDLTFITGAGGLPLAKESFGNYFAGWSRAAGIMKSAHGLRKMAATAMADAGATEMQLQAAFGWVTNHQSSVYTRTASRERLAKEAGEKRMANSSIPAPFPEIPAPKKREGNSNG